MKQPGKTLLLWVVLIVAFMAIWEFVNKVDGQEVPYSEFLKLTAMTQGRRVTTLAIQGSTYEFEVTEPRKGQVAKYRSIGPEDSKTLAADLTSRGVRVEYRKEASGLTTSVVTIVLPMLLVVLIFYLFVRQIQSGGGKAMSFGKSGARLLNETQNKITFTDVKGVDDAQNQVKEIVDFLKDPKRFQRLGGRLPKGLLLVGSPGTGKTLLARAIAGEAGVPFFTMSGSNFVEMFVGVGASRVRDLFEQAKRQAPCIIFIDEIDAVGRHRGSTFQSGGHDEREQTLNQLLVEMDGFESNEGVILVAATNRPELLDPAILRPGRFDRQVVVQPPNHQGREEILRLLTKKIPLGREVSMQMLARLSSGFTGADLAKCVNEAALRAARENRESVSAGDLEDAIGQIRRGLTRRLSLDTAEDTWRVAMHEVGHLCGSVAFPSIQLVEALSLHAPFRVRMDGLAGASGAELVSHELAMGTLIVLLAGRAAEEVFLGKPSNLCEPDLASASAVAFGMVTRWGMGDGVGLTNTSLIRSQDMDMAMTNDVRSEVKTLLDHAYTVAVNTIVEHSEQVLEWSQLLMEREALAPTWVDKARASSKFKTQARNTGTTRSRIPVPAAAPNNAVAPSSAERVEVLKKRAHALQLSHDAMGMHAPPHVITELEQIRSTIAELESTTGARP